MIRITYLHKEWLEDEKYKQEYDRLEAALLNKLFELFSRR